MKDKEGDTALHYAVREDQVECAKLLIEEIDLANNKNQIPLYSKKDGSDCDGVDKFSAC